MKPDRPDRFDSGLCTPAPEPWPQIAAALAARRLPVPPRWQRRRWEAGGILGEPWQSYLKGHGGSVTYYPAGTTERLVAILALRPGQRVRVDTLRFELWWRGVAVDDLALRDMFVRSVARACRPLADLFERHRGDPAGFADSVEALVRKNFRRPRGALFRLIMKRLGQNVEDMISFVSIVAFVVAGGFVKRDEYDANLDERSLMQILDDCFGAERARTDTWPNEKPILQEPLDVLSEFEQLASAGVLDPTRLPALVAEADPAAFALARDRARMMIEQLGGSADAVEFLRGQRDAFGLGHFAVIFRQWAVARVRGSVVLALLALPHAIPEENIDHLLDLINEGAPGAIALGNFVRAHPSYLKDFQESAKTGFEGMDVEKRRKMREELIAFLADQPELTAQLQHR